MIRDIETHHDELAALCRRYQVRHLELFGSAVTVDLDSDSSDLDFLVEFQLDDSAGYADMYFGLLEGLSSLFDRPVDLVIESAITNPYFREAVDRSRTLLYAS